MMTELVIMILTLGLSALAGIAAVRAMAARQWRPRLVGYRLSFPRDLKSEAVVQFAASLSGLGAAGPLGPVKAIVFETVARAGRIEHYMLVPRSVVAPVLSQLRATLPGVRTTEASPEPLPRLNLAAEWRLANWQRPLRVDSPEAIIAGILAALQPLNESSEEALCLQWIVTAAGSVTPVGAGSSLRAAGWPTSPAKGLGDPAARRAARAKQASPVFMAVVRAGAAAESPARAGHLFHRLTATLGVTAAPGVKLQRRQLPNQLVVRALTERRLPVIGWPCLLNAQELGALIGFPLGSQAVMGLVRGGSRVLAPSPEIATHGRVLGQATGGAGDRRLALSPADSLHHLHIIGPTGVGKSTLLLNLITQDMAAGFGVVVIDPKGDLVADALERVPRERLDEVVVFDPADDGRPVGFNLLAAGARSPELVVEGVVSIFHQLFSANWGPRTDDILRAALLTLAVEPGLTLCEVPLILTDPSLRSRLVGRTEDYVLAQFWSWYEAISPGERMTVIAPLMNKLRTVLLRRRIRNMVGQADGGLDLDQVVRQGGILLVSLAKGLVGAESAELVGALLVARLWQAVMQRAALPPVQRHPLFVYVDEVQDYLRLPTDIGDALAQARGLGCSLNLAHQHLGQLPTGLRAAIMANARSRVIFQSTADDARVLARELVPYLEAADLQGLDRYEVVTSLMAHGRVAPPATGVTFEAAAKINLGEIARGRSRQRFGRDRGEVEAAILARQANPGGAGPVGRTRRAS